MNQIERKGSDTDTVRADEGKKQWNFFTCNKLIDDPKVCNNKIRRRRIITIKKRALAYKCRLELIN